MIWYELSLDVEQINRSVYTYFQALGDTGGLNGILISIASLIVSVLNFNKAENFLVSMLYRDGE